MRESNWCIRNSNFILSVRVSELVSYATSREHVQCATGNPVPVPVDPVDFFQIRFRSGSGQIPTGSTGFDLLIWV